jgi:hypothetical protein
LEDIDVDGRTILELVFKKQSGGVVWFRGGIKRGDFVRTTMNLLAEQSVGYFMDSFGPISLFMDLFSRLLCIVSVNIDTSPSFLGLNDMKRLLDFKLSLCSECCTISSG